MTKNALPGSMATFLMIFSMMPFFALGLYEKNGEPLEAVLRHIIESRYLRPRRRIYQTQNIYALLEKQAQLEEVYKDREQWIKKAIINVSRSHYFTSDRSIEEYNQKIWKLSRL